MVCYLILYIYISLFVHQLGNRAHLWEASRFWSQGIKNEHSFWNEFSQLSEGFGEALTVYHRVYRRAFSILKAFAALEGFKAHGSFSPGLVDYVPRTQQCLLSKKLTFRCFLECSNEPNELGCRSCSERPHIYTFVFLYMHVLLKCAETKDSSIKTENTHITS